VYKEFFELNFRLNSMMEKQALAIQFVFDSVLQELSNQIPCKLTRQFRPLSVTGPREKKLGYFGIENDGLTLSYYGKGQTREDVVMIRSNFAVNLGQQGFYFEIDIIEEGTSRALAIGICRTDCLLQGMPGWYPGSIGYHGDDGNIFLGDSGRVEPTNVLFGKYDVVGCGYAIKRGIIFFTKNGRTVWEIPFQDQREYFLVGGIHSMNAVVRFNFGEKPFKCSGM